MSTRFYPIYQRGGPQLRIFLPNFWMKLVKSKEPLPPNVVLFQTSIQMTKYDVKNYLEKIYKIPVVDVKVSIQMGKIKKILPENCLRKDEDYKEALVYLPKDYEFEFPEIKDTTTEEEKRKFKEKKAEHKESLKSKTPYVPGWFSKFN